LKFDNQISGPLGLSSGSYKNMICFMHMEIKEAVQQNCNTSVQASTAGRSATVIEGVEDARF
jgi:hypothetical protein